MSRRTILIGCLIVLVLLPLILVLFIPWIREYELARRTESDYLTFRDSSKTELYFYYPELLERIARDQELAKRVEVVYPTQLLGDQDYSALLKFPNLRKIEVMYGRQLQGFVPTLIALPALQEATFAYCDPYGEWATEIKHPSLGLLRLHAYQATQIPDALVAKVQENMPQCQIQVTFD